MVWVFLVTLFALVAIGMPVAFTLGISGLILASLQNISYSIAVQRAIAGMNSFPLLAIPFYLLLGEVMNQGSLAKRLVRMANALIGWIPGGLGQAAVLASMFMGGISGSAVADSSAIGGLLIGPMSEQGYSKHRAGGLVGTASVLGIIIPPSIPFVLFGISTGTSIARMFLGGFIPGVILGLMLMVVVYFQWKKGGTGAATVKFSPRELWGAFQESWSALIIPVIVVGGILGGIFTATEAGAAATAVALCLSLIFFRDITLKTLGKIFLVAARTTAMVLFLVATASVTAWLLTTARVPDNILALLLSISQNPTVVLLLIHGFLLIVGCVMDLTPALLILAPILLPIAVKLGFDPVFFGVTMCINLGIGLVTPPVGTILYIMAGITKEPLDRLIPSFVPYIIVMVIGLVLLLLFPPLTTFLPTLFLGKAGLR